MGTDQHGGEHRRRQPTHTAISAMTSRMPQRVLCLLLVTILLALSPIVAALAAETMVLHIPSQTMILA